MKCQLEEQIAAVCRELFGQTADVELTRPDQKFGDYATNVALQLSVALHQNPRQLAETILPKLQAVLAETVENITIAGPGFINLRLSDAALLEAIKTEPARTLEEQVTLAEYSDPNPFKPLHAGHLYTTLVGDVIARLLERGGAKVTRLNYGGDVGLHVGKSMWAIIQTLGGEQPDKLNKVPVSERADWLGQRYVEGSSAYEEDEDSRQVITELNQRVYQLHQANDHDSAFAQIYWTCRQWSYDYFTQLYDKLQVHQFDRVIPESEIVPLGIETVRQHVGDTYEESDGAIIFRGENYGLHTRVFINSKDLPTYEAKDVGLLLTKWRDYHFDRSLVITANEQEQYMAVMLKSVEQFEPDPAHRSQHLTHGVVKLKGGVKMSSRKGNVVNALDILEAATQAHQKLIGQDNDQAVLGAVKYAFLKNRIGGDILYDPEESVSLEGNSGPYLQYAHARARSILRKVEEQGQLQADFQPTERSLLSKLTEYPEVLDRAIAELTPHHICTYLYELAQAFNSFYEHSQVIGDQRQGQRLALVNLYADRLKNGLELLGITALDQM